MTDDGSKLKHLPAVATILLWMGLSWLKPIVSTRVRAMIKYTMILEALQLVIGSNINVVLLNDKNIDRKTRP